MPIHLEERICKKPNFIGLVCGGGRGGESQTFSALFLPWNSSASQVLWLDGVSFKKRILQTSCEVCKWDLESSGPTQWNPLDPLQSQARLFYWKTFRLHASFLYPFPLVQQPPQLCCLVWKPPCSDLTWDLMALFDGSQLLQCHTRAGGQVTLCAHPAAQPALHTGLLPLIWEIFHPATGVWAAARSGGRGEQGRGRVG